MALSAREQQVLELLSKGYSNKEIAERLNVSVDRIRGDLKHVYEQLHLRSRIKAATQFSLGNVPILAAISLRSGPL